MSAEGLPRMQIQGFSDVRYSVTGQKRVPSTFTLGQVNLFMTSKLAENVNVVSELVVQADATNTFGVRISRLLLQYNASDYFNLSAGRYHTSIGFYNTAFHHSTWMQTGFDRPFLYTFEDVGGILPIHGIGLSAAGAIPSGGLGLHYVAELSNGRTSSSPLVKATQSQQDENNGKAFNLALFARPLSLRGFQTGFSVYRDVLHPQVTSSLTPYGRRVGQFIFAGYAVYQGGKLEFLNEFVTLRHAVQNGPVYHIPAFYSQVSTPIGKVRPYFRYEYLNIPRNEPMFGAVGLRYGPSAGIRYDFTDFAAYKVEYFRLAQRDIGVFNGMRTQIAFVF